MKPRQYLERRQAATPTGAQLLAWSAGGVALGVSLGLAGGALGGAATRTLRGVGRLGRVVLTTAMARALAD